METQHQGINRFDSRKRSPSLFERYRGCLLKHKLLVSAVLVFILLGSLATGYFVWKATHHKELPAELIDEDRTTCAPTECPACPECKDTVCPEPAEVLPNPDACLKTGESTMDLALPPNKWAITDYLRDFSSADAVTLRRKTDDNDNSLLVVANEVSEIVRRRAEAIQSHMNNERDHLLDDPDLPEDCRAMLKNPKAHKECWGMEGKKCPGEDPFQAQFSQDFMYYHNFLRNTDAAKRGHGFYLDVGACEPKWISNTYFLDHCLGWKGICIEANPTNRKKWKNSGRTCKMIPKCVSDKEETLKISIAGPMSKVGKGETEVPCQTLESILTEEGVTHVDFMTMDVEGSEEKILRSTSLHKFKIDVIAVEVNHQPIGFDTFFFRQGYTKITDVEIDDLYMRGIPILVSDKFGQFRYAREEREQTWPEEEA